MNVLTYLAGLAGVVVLFIYFVVAARKKKKPDLATAVTIFVNTVAAFGGLRLFGYLISGQFAATVKIVGLHGATSVWSLATEDWLFIFVGALALVWVSCQGVLKGFAEL